MNRLLFSRSALPSPAKLQTTARTFYICALLAIFLSSVLFVSISFASLWRVQVGANQLLSDAYSTMDTHAVYARSRLSLGAPSEPEPPATDTATSTESWQFFEQGAPRRIQKAHWLATMAPCNCSWQLSAPSIPKSWGPLRGNLSEPPLPPSFRFSLWGSRHLPWTSMRYITKSYVLPGGAVLTLGYPLSEILSPFREQVASTWGITFAWGGLSFLITTLIAFAFIRFRGQDHFLRQLAYTDDLTGVPNRRHFDFALSSKPPSALALLDLNNFKEINDTYGHAAGDALLAQVAQRLASKIRAGSDTVFRLGGDEFAILFYDVPDPSAQLANRIPSLLHQVFSEPFVLSDTTLDVRASCGWVTTSDNPSLAQWLQFADLAMYQAKKRKSARKVSLCEQFKPSFFTQAQEDLELLTALSQALQAPPNSRALVLHYQPKISTGPAPQVAGVEALLRFTHSGKPVSPLRIVDIAEKNNLMDTLGFWVLSHALDQQIQWFKASGKWMPVAVNVSPTQLVNPRFVSELEFIVNQAQVPPQYLQLEIAESSLLAAGTPAVLARLRALGFPLALDDFGTGFSSYATLADVEFDYLKLDRSFVTRLNDPKGRQLCKSLIATGTAYRMAVIAEGVEEPWQASALESLGAHQVQGWLYAKAMDPSQVLDWVAAYDQASTTQPPHAAPAPSIPTEEAPALPGCLSREPSFPAPSKLLSQPSSVVFFD